MDYKEFKKLVEEDGLKNPRKKILVHYCCAPCSSYVINFLKNYYDITLYFTNDNIDTFDEYIKRKDEIFKFIDDDIKIMQADYKSKDFYDAVKGYEHLKEKSYRCYKCYRLRLEKTAKCAKENNFDYFTTTLSVSPYKISKWINEIGYEFESKYDIKYLYSDFKKEEGYKKSIQLSKENNLYRQEYCGCVFSKHEMMEKNNENNLSN